MHEELNVSRKQDYVFLRCPATKISYIVNVGDTLLSDNCCSAKEATIIFGVSLAQLDG